jgi:hypothetical protein
MAEKFDMNAAGPEEAGEESAAPAKSSASPYRRQMLRANIILACLLLVGVGVVYALSQRKGPATASAEQQAAESQVDSALLRLSGQGALASGTAKPTQKLLAEFFQQVSDRQVPLDRLGKNPFLFVRPGQSLLTATQPQAGGTVEAEPAAAPVKQDIEQVKAALKRLRLQSVMMGGNSGGTALISNNLLTVGQRIDCFVVQAIQPGQVVLGWEDREFTLKMQ